MQTKPGVATTLGAAGLLIFAGMANAVEIKVLSSNAIKEAYLELVLGFEKATEHRVATTWAGTNDIMKRMQAGETFDLVIMAGPSIDELIKQGKIVAGSRVAQARHQVRRCTQARVACGQIDRLFLGPQRRLSRRAVSADGHCR